MVDLDGEREGVGELLQEEAEAREREEAEAAQAQAEVSAAAEREAEAKEAAEVAAAARVAAEDEAGAALGWARVSAANGPSYWYHAAKNQTCRDLPLDLRAKLNEAEGTAFDGLEGAANDATPTEAAGTGGGAGEGAGAGTGEWASHVDEQGRAYFYNSVTRETSWQPR